MLDARRLQKEACKSSPKAWSITNEDMYIDLTLQPWQKSEKTVWVPPDYKPTFVTSSSRHKKPATAQEQSPLPADAPELEESDEDGEEDHHEEPDIDPALQQPHQQSHHTGEPDGSQQPVAPPNPYQNNAHQIPPMQSINHQQRSLNTSNATYNQANQPHLSHQSTLSQPRRNPQGKNVLRQSNSTPAIQSRQKVSRPSQSQPAVQGINKPDEAFAALQQQLAERDAVIASLQQQLTAQQQQQHQHQHGHYSQQQQYQRAESTSSEQAQSHPQYHDMRHNPGVFDSYHITPDIPPTRPRQRPTEAGSQSQPLQHFNYVSAGGHWPTG